jgi:hypothetical protein
MNLYVTDLAAVCVSERESGILKLADDLRRARIEDRFPEYMQRVAALLADIERVARFKHGQGAKR